MSSFNLVSPVQGQFLRLEESLVDHISKLDLQLESLSTAQEELFIVKDYLERTEAPFLVLSNLHTAERFLGKQCQELLSLSNISSELIMLVRQLRRLKSIPQTDTDSSVVAASSSSILASTASPATKTSGRKLEINPISTLAVASSSSAIDSTASPAPKSFVHNLEIHPIPTVEVVPSLSALASKESPLTKVSKCRHL
jgi:hypothetical protein